MMMERLWCGVFVITFHTAEVSAAKQNHFNICHTEYMMGEHGNNRLTLWPSNKQFFYYLLKSFFFTLYL